MSQSDKRAPLMLWILMLVYVLNFLDRQIVNILAEPISKDLGLSDTQIGMLTGLAFALFYTVLGIPIARLADRKTSNRVTIISVSLAIWSGMTALSGYAQNFTQMLLARMGVGVGEAGCTPAAMSLITDSVPAEKRSAAIGFYGLGVPIGGMLGAVLGGQLADFYGWRSAFLIVGVPGLLLALFLPFALREPRREKSFMQEQVARPQAAALPLWQALMEIGKSRAFVLIMVAASFTAFLGYGKTTWAAIYFIRIHGLTPGEVGLIIGLVAGAAGAIGTWGGGFLADRFAKQGVHRTFFPTAVGMAIGTPLLALAYSHPDWRWAIALLVIPTACNLLYYGPTYASVQSLVRPEARATATSIMMFAQNLIGLGLGPLFFGMLSDALKPSLGADSVQAVLIAASCLAIIPAFLFWRGSLHLTRELRSDA
jgi:MFS family permease